MMSGLNHARGVDIAIAVLGSLLFGLRERLGTGGALLFQTAISTLVHIGKPVGELVGAAPAGFLFGAAALRTRSVLWPLLLHWYLGALMDVESVRRAHGGAPLATAAALLVTVAFALPLYLLKIELLPREAMWLPGVLFVALVLPAGIVTVWFTSSA